MLPVLARDHCSRLYGQKARISAAQVCAGGREGRGICNGDSGGPLQCFRANEWLLLGLDSFTVPCALNGFPSVFTRVAYYWDWISGVIELNSNKQ
jgi:secreted trypsin-like serine protease